jgi:hypothetical protein
MAGGICFFTAEAYIGDMELLTSPTIVTHVYCERRSDGLFRIGIVTPIAPINRVGTASDVGLLLNNLGHPLGHPLESGQALISPDGSVFRI